jgi:hypothetical protein
LNAIDRVESLKEKYQKNLVEQTQNIQQMEQIICKPFDKDAELSQLRSHVAKLEREISIKIQTNQMKQHEGEIHPPSQKNDAVIIELNTKENANVIDQGKHTDTLLVKNQITPKKVKGLRI